MNRHGLSKRIVLGVFLMVLVSVFVYASGKQESSSASAKQAKLVVWINGSDSYIGPSEKKLPQKEWYISQAFRRFEKANPGVSIELQVPASQEAAMQQFKVAALAGNAPDVANLWTGLGMFALKDVLLPLDNRIPKADLQEITGWITVRNNFKPDGVILGYPASQNQIAFLMYNKKIVRDAGLDFETNPPTTVKEFSADLAKIKQSGKIPIITNEKFPWFYLWIGVYWWAQLTGPATISAETYGSPKFAADKGLLDSLAYYHSLYANGYFNKDMATSSDAWNRFLQGDAAMTPVVTSFLGDAEKALGKDAGVLAPPDFNANVKIKNGAIGGPGQSLVVPNNTKHPELAVKLMSFLNSKQEVLLQEKVHAFPVLRKDISFSDLGISDPLVKKLFPYAQRYVYFVDNRLTSPVAQVFYKELPLVAVGQLSPAQLASKMDTAAQK